MEKKLINVSVADIDVGDDTYRLPQFADTSLAASIREIGLINPPLLQRRPGSRFRIVCGFRRIEALRQLAVAETVAWVIEQPATLVEIFLVALLDNLALRPFDPVQLSVIIEKLRRWGVSDNDLVQKIFPKLKLGKNPKLLELYDRLHWLPAEWQRALANDQVPLDLSGMVVDLAEEERTAFWRLIFDLRLGKNRQREFLLLLQDVARIMEKAIPQVIAAEEVQAIIRAERITPSQKAERLKEWLWQKRYPRYVAAKGQFEELLKQAALPDGVTLRHSPFFQDDQLQLTVNFRSAVEFDARLDAVQRLRQSGQIEKFIKLT